MPRLLNKAAPWAAMLLAGLAYVTPASASSTVTQGFVTITGDVATALTPQVIYTVPGGRWLVVTDVVIVNYNSVNCDLVIGNGPAYLTSELRTPANGSFSLHLTTGLLFDPHAPVYVVTDERLPGDGACTPTFTFMGKLLKSAPALD